MYHCIILSQILFFLTDKRPNRKPKKRKKERRKNNAKRVLPVFELCEVQTKVIGKQLTMKIFYSQFYL